MCLGQLSLCCSRCNNVPLNSLQVAVAVRRTYDALWQDYFDSASGEVDAMPAASMHWLHPERTVVGDKDEADGCNVQATDGEQPGLQRAIRVLPPPLRHRCVTAFTRGSVDIGRSVAHAAPE